MKSNLNVIHEFNKEINELHFTKIKSTWWGRKINKIIQAIHIHKFSFARSFRIHSAIHIDGYKDDENILNGISSNDGWYHKCKLGFVVAKYNFDYTENDDRILKAAKEMAKFTNDIIIPWFDDWSDINKLITNTKSPLTDGQKTYLNLHR